MTTIWRDVTYGARVLRRSPLLTLAAILALALGIGANSAIFTVLNAVLLRPLPYEDSERLVSVGIKSRANDGSSLSVADFLMVREGLGDLGQAVAYYAPRGGLALTSGGASEQVRAAWTTVELFDVLGRRPAIGRPFKAGDDAPSAEPVVVLSGAFWKRRFGADPAIVGKTIVLDGTSRTVIGVAPEDLSFPPGGASDLIALMRLETPRARAPFYLQTIARPRPGVSPERLRTALAGVATQVQRAFPEMAPDWTLEARPLKELLVGGVRPALLVLLGSVSLVLVIATVNIANLLLARATARRKEMAIRAALGAGRWRLARQLLTESLLLAAIGGAFGLLIALWGTDLLVAMSPQNLPRLNEIGVDPRVLLYTLAVSLASGLLFGMAPAFQVARAGMAPALHDSGRGVTDRTGRRIRSVLVIGELALAVMLLGGAGLLINSFYRLQQVSPGFETGGILSARLSLPEGRYPNGQSRIVFFQTLVDRLSQQPGVQSAALGMALPPNLAVMTNPYTMEERPAPPGQSPPLAGQLLITPGWFKSLGVPLLRGRLFTDADNAGAPLVALIDETMARTLYPDQDPVGHRLQLGNPGPEVPWTTIIGVVGNVKYTGLDDAPQPTVYTSYYQEDWWPTMYLAVRSSLDKEALANSMRSAIAALDPMLPVAEVRTIPDLMSASVAEPRFRTTLVGTFAAVALLLAAIGIYGILSYAVSLRTQEMGIRMALGASRSDVLRLVLGQGMALAAAGVAAGLAGSLALGRLLRGLLFGLSPNDPATYALVAATMLAVAFCACYLPARRATRVDPMVALRSD